MFLFFSFMNEFTDNNIPHYPYQELTKNQNHFRFQQKVHCALFKQKKIKFKYGQY